MLATYGRSGVNSFKGAVFSSIRKYVKRLFIRKYRGFSVPVVRHRPCTCGTLADSLV